MKGRAGPIVISRIVTECPCSVGLAIPEAAAAMDEKSQDMPIEYTGCLCKCACLPEWLPLRFKPSRSISNLLKNCFWCVRGRRRGGKCKEKWNRSKANHLHLCVSWGKALFTLSRRSSLLKCAETHWARARKPLLGDGSQEGKTHSKPEQP